MAFAYLIYSLHDSWREANGIRDGPIIVLGVGALFPDLVDKPLAWTFALLPSGRSLAHSLLTVIAISVLLLWLARTARERLLAGAFSFGHFAHLLGDTIPGLMAGELSAIYFWNWPFGPHPVYENDSSFIAHFESLNGNLGQLVAGDLTGTGFLPVELLLIVVAVIVWRWDGYPGLHWLRESN